MEGEDVLMKVGKSRWQEVYVVRWRWKYEKGVSEMSKDHTAGVGVQGKFTVMTLGTT